MPWNVSSVMEARREFVELVFDEHLPVAEACRRAGISRKTGFKFLSRYRRQGLRGLQDASRCPRSSPAQVSAGWQKLILRLRRKHPHWGGRKIYDYFRRHAPAQKRPRARTIQRWVGLLGLVKKRPRKSRRGPAVPYAGLTPARQPNHVWTIDFKGWVRTADGQRQEPLTVRDLYSRYGLCLRLLASQEDGAVRTVLRALFQKNGLPAIIRVDNGSPFAGTGPLGLSRLSVWWLRLGIRVELTRRARPGDNAAHEQFHGRYQHEVIEPAPAANTRQLQRRSARWLKDYNEQRPHEALRGKTPAQLYRSSRRKYRGEPPPLVYGRQWETRRVRNRGTIKWQGRLRNIGRPFVGQTIGLRQTKSQPRLWNVYLGQHLIGQLHEKDSTGLRAAKYEPASKKKP